MAEVQENTQSEINISDIFQKKQSIIDAQDQTTENEPPKEEKQQPKQKHPPKEPIKVTKEIEKDEDEDDDLDNEEIIEEKDEKKVKNSQEESIDYKSEVESLQKKLKDTQKWGNEAHKKLSNYSRKLQKYKEDALLTEDETKDLLEYVESQESTKADKMPLERWGEIWDKDIAYRRRYHPNQQELDRHIWAFQHFMQNASKEEVKEALEELEDLEKDISKEDDEISFTNKMLEIGQGWNEDIFNDIVEAGGVRNLRNHFGDKEKKLQKQLDKALKEYDKLKKKYEDYSENPPMGLPTGSSPDNPSKEYTTDPAEIFKKRWQTRY